MSSGLKYLLVAAGVTAAGVGLYLYSQYNSFIKSIKDAFTKTPKFKVKALSPSNISIELIYQIINKTDFSATVYDQDYDVYVNDKVVGKITNKKEVSIYSAQKTGKTIIPSINFFNILLNLSPAELAKSGLKNLSAIIDPEQRKNVVINIKGKYKYRSGILSGSQDLTESFTLAEVTSKS